MKIIDYNIVSGALISEFFTLSIKRLMDDGWQPYGNLLVDTNNYFVQAMVKYDDK